MSRGSGQGHWKRARRCGSSSAGRKGERFYSDEIERPEKRFVQVEGYDGKVQRGEIGPRGGVEQRRAGY